MKKSVSILLILLLAANISGASISYHFCGKVFQYFAFNGQKKKSHCCCSGTQKKKGCCTTQHCKIKVDDSQTMAKQLLFAKQLVVEAIIPLPVQPVQQDIWVSHNMDVIPLAHAPPFLRTVPLHILHQQFLI